jgi:hypothetical protein
VKSPRLFARVLLAYIALSLVLVPSRAHAVQGLALAWNHCFGEAGWAQNAAFACDVNTGFNELVGTFRLSTPITGATGHEVVIELASESASLPAWWSMGSSLACRSGSFNAGIPHDEVDVTCPDWSEGSAPTQAAIFKPNLTHPNLLRILLVTGVTPGHDLMQDQDYWLFTIRINHAKTVGAGSCGGCNIPVCIVFNSDLVGWGPYPDQRLVTGPLTPGSDFASWQGGGSPIVGGKIGCPAATPTRRSTWGSVKTLYR